jgi:2,3-bisphosphoglycerate-dependent phosphoglycerate mutase
MDKEDERSPFQDPRYAWVDEKDLPLTESLKECIARILPYWENNIRPALEKEGEILVAAHGNSLRGIVKVLKNISNEDIVGLNLPTAVPYVFEFDDNMNLVKDYFLWDPEEIKKLMEAVANQGKKK